MPDPPVAPRLLARHWSVVVGSVLISLGLFASQLIGAAGPWLFAASPQSILPLIMRIESMQPWTLFLGMVLAGVGGLSARGGQHRADRAAALIGCAGAVVGLLMGAVALLLIWALSGVGPAR